MRYLGSKAKLIKFIHDTFKKFNIEGQVFCDLFAGTSCVADSFKGEYEIIANDFMRYSYCFSKAKLRFGSTPLFENFFSKFNQGIFEWLNENANKKSNYSFIYDNYSPIGERMFFTESNAKKIDCIRSLIEQLYVEQLVDENEYYFLLASLLDCVTKYSNTSGTYEAFFKFWDNRALKDFVIEPIEFNQSETIKECTIYQENSNDLLRKIHGDILYVDPPYTVTQYASAYNVLETIALKDVPKIKGVGGKRDKGVCVSNYCYKKKAIYEFEDLFRQAQFTHIVIRYSHQGVVALSELIELAKKFAVDGIVQVENVRYQEYQNHRASNKRNGESLKEVLIYFKKDISVLKSPLNYAGSKDKMFTVIQRYFPKHIETFVDVMGGAFNMGVNVYATDKIIYNDVNPYVEKIVRWLLTEEKLKIVDSVQKTIEMSGMEKANSESYNKLKEYYNANKSVLALFVLHMYSFQNYIRFNKAQQFNTPIGVAGYSSDLKNRILKFVSRCPHLSFLNENFINIDWDKFDENTLFYFDPPYFITKAAYNDGKRGLAGWGINEENCLFSILEHLHKKGFKFIMSNVKEHKGTKNIKLVEWVNKNNFKMYELGVSGWRYAKNEIIVTNY